MIGNVVSNKMDKTLVVAVTTTKTHSKYGKKYKSRKKYKVHCQDSKKFLVGQQVEFVSSRPFAKSVKMQVIE